MPLTNNELIGTLMSFEAERMNDEEDHKGKKSITLISNIHDSSDTDSKEDKENDEDVAQMVKKFINKVRKGRNFSGKKKTMQGTRRKKILREQRRRFRIRGRERGKKEKEK